MVLFIFLGRLDFSLIGFLQVQRERVRPFPAERRCTGRGSYDEGREKEKKKKRLYDSGAYYRGGYYRGAGSHGGA